MKSIFALIGLFLVASVLLVIAGIGRAFVGITLYRWFALPLGFPQISMGQLFGLMCLVAVVWQVSTPKSEKKEEKSTPVEDFVLLLIKLAGEIGFPLLFGYIIKSIIY